MARQNGLYIAQVTDIHVGCNTLNGNAARQYLPMALEEIAGLEPQPRCILATADLVCAGRRAELEEYVGLSASCRLPIVAIPANHDLWGEPGDQAWQDLLGASRVLASFPGLLCSYPAVTECVLVQGLFSPLREGRKGALAGG